jgi:hypothetical protein
MKRSLIAGCGVLALMSAASAPADPPPARPDYLFALPEREWTFAKLLWQGRESCTPEVCEAGYHSGDLVVSVIRWRDSVAVVAGIRDCAAVSHNFVSPDQLAALSAEQRAARLAEIVRSIAPFARRGCNRPDPDEVIDTTSLSQLGLPVD